MEQNQNPQRIVRPYEERDLAAMREIWNEVVRDGAAFPQIDELADDDEAKKFFDSQTVTVVVESEGRLLGLYILHPNNVGRCGHIANSSYAVASAARGMHLGRLLCAIPSFVLETWGFACFSSTRWWRAMPPRCICTKK